MGACVEKGGTVMDILETEYGLQIKTLNETLWDNKAHKPKIDAWLNNFEDETEKEYALFLLSKLMYFNDSNIRRLLQILYKDLFRYPIIEDIRKKNNNTLNEQLIEESFIERLNKTRFLAVGDPSESGGYLLYYFRQENKLMKQLFVNIDDVIANNKLNEKHNDLNFVFIDDLCGSGMQATSNGSNVKRCVEKIRCWASNAKVSYFVLFGMTDGLNNVRNSRLYDSVEAVIEIDESYRCFGERSRFFELRDEEKKQKIKAMAERYGYKLALDIAKREYWVKDKEAEANANKLGFRNCQLLLSMNHNTPNNTLPIIWYDEDNCNWTPIFKRYNKVYGKL